MTDAEREAMLQEAEEDALIFATTVGVLAEFISELPDGRM
jgi:hypothetical protein